MKKCLQYPFICKTEIAGFGDNEVIKNDDVEQFPCLYQLAGQFRIGLARLEVPRRMVIAKDDRAGQAIDRFTKDHLGIDDGAGHSPQADLLPPDHPVGIAATPYLGA